MDNNLYENGGNFTPQQEQKKRDGTKKKTVALIICCAAAAVFLGGAGYSLGREEGKAEAQKSGPMSTVMEGVRASSVIDVTYIDTNEKMTAAEVYAANVNSTVGITTSVTTNYWGFQTTSAASGSGFIITDDGYIVTNYHVIENSDTITVSLYDGTSYEAELTGYDESNDIAVLKVEAEGLTPVVLGDSDNLNVGDEVIAIGNPLGELTFSLTSGSVSALNREITLSNNVTMDLIQTDCAINSGNSGGALFNLYGEVIGVTNAKYSGSGSGASIDNIGFAIPINSVRGIIESIIENGYITKPYIGVSVSDVSAETQSYGLPAGAAVRSVEEDGPVAAAGIEANDIITAVNGEEISGSSALVDIVGAAQPGDKLTLTVYRQGEYTDVEVTVGEQIKSALENEETEQESGQEQQNQNRGRQGGTMAMPQGSIGGLR